MKCKKNDDEKYPDFKFQWKKHTLFLSASNRLPSKRNSEFQKKKIGPGQYYLIQSGNSHT